jgi:hypothetical protein
MSELTKDQRASFFDGDYPTLKGEGKCPWTPWEPYFLSKRFWITPIAVHRDGDRWRIDYKVADHRDRYLGAAPTMSEAERQSRRWSHDLERGYTSNPHAPLADAGTAVDPKVQEQQSKDANRKWALHMAEDRRMEVAQQQARTINNKIKRLVSEAAKLEIDVTPKLAVALRDIENDIAKARNGNPA